MSFQHKQIFIATCNICGKEEKAEYNVEFGADPVKPSLPFKWTRTGNLFFCPEHNYGYPLPKEQLDKPSGYATMDFVLEKVEIAEKKFMQMDERLDKHYSIMEALERRISNLEKRANYLCSEVEVNHTEFLHNLDHTAREHSEKLDALEKKLDGIDKTVARSIRAVSNRSYDLEGNVQGVEEKVDALEEKLKGIKAWCEIRCAEIKDML